MDKFYVDTVRLMLEVAPEVFASGRFALKGGTAINLFVQDMPRLSVDIDVVFVPHRLSREAALAEIASELAQIQARLQHRGIKAEVASSKTGDETKILARRDRTEVKVEINYVFRGTLLPVELRPLSKAASDLFTTALTVPTLVGGRTLRKQTRRRARPPASAGPLRCPRHVRTLRPASRVRGVLRRLHRRAQPPGA